MKKSLKHYSSGTSLGDELGAALASLVLRTTDAFKCGYENEKLSPLKADNDNSSYRIV